MGKGEQWENTTTMGITQFGNSWDGVPSHLHLDGSNKLEYKGFPFN